jgi:hypothetical protein
MWDEIRFRKAIHRIGRPGLRKNDTEKDSNIGVGPTAGAVVMVNEEVDRFAFRAGNADDQSANPVQDLDRCLNRSLALESATLRQSFKIARSLCSHCDTN